MWILRRITYFVYLIFEFRSRSSKAWKVEKQYKCFRRLHFSALGSCEVVVGTAEALAKTAAESVDSAKT